jgi:hypothetical protein
VGAASAAATVALTVAPEKFVSAVQLAANWQLPVPLVMVTANGVLVPPPAVCVSVPALTVQGPLAVMIAPWSPLVSAVAENCEL